jgi:hypothetical protein
MVQPMRTTSLVVILTFVFASSAFLMPASSAQSSSVLEGVVCPTAAQGSPQPASSKPGYECSWMQGIPGATVTLTKPGPLVPAIGAFNQSRTTDDGGRFTFTGLESGNYTMTTSRAGFDSATVTVSIGSGTTHRDQMLAARTVQAAGKVADSDGAPVAGAQVSFCCNPDQVSNKTGSDGRFSVSLKAGWSSINVQASGFHAFYDHRFLDGSEIPNMVLERVPPTDATLRGIVRDQAGNPVEGVRVSAYSYGGCDTAASPEQGTSSSSSPPCMVRPYSGGENFTFTNAQGSYVLGVYSGQGSLNVQKSSYASYSMQFSIASGQDKTQDLTIKKIPDKTATIVGKIASGGSPVRYAYLSVNSPEFGTYECSSESGGGSGSGKATATSVSSGAQGGQGTASSPSVEGDRVAGPAYESSCAIRMSSDGTFEGRVTPGYTIVSVWVDSYRACAENHDADGSFSRTCGPEYYSWSRSLNLPANETTRIDIALQARPEPNAVVSGYLISSETGRAIPGATISFSNAENYGYGYATTDSDGSYKLRLRSGYHNIYAYAENHFRWEGTLTVPRGESGFDVQLTPGQESHGGWYGYAEDGAVARTGTSTSSPSGAPSSGDLKGPQADQGGSGQAYIDLGGGLGPYNAAQRKAQLEGNDNGAPGAGTVLLLAALLGAVLVVRRRQH